MRDITLLELDEKIAQARRDLHRTKQLGETQSRTREDEIYETELQVYKKNHRLHRKGEHAKQYLSFWEYVEVVNTVLHRDSSPLSRTSGTSGEMTLDEHRAQLKAKAEEESRKSSSLIEPSSYNFNICSFFELLLRSPSSKPFC